MTFQPAANSTFEIDGLTYRVAEHPAAPGVAYGQEGRAATAYQVVDSHGTAWALKVFRPHFRAPALVSLADKLATFATIPGLSVCRRTVLTSRKHTELLRQYPDLTYAVLMPWVYGPTWMEVVLEQRALTLEQSLQLARALLHLLAEMEERGLAHCDLSGPNLILPALAANPSAHVGADVALVDVEQMFGPDLSKPELLLGGSAGYAHKTAPTGLWSSNADRFAGAVLLAEMLGWRDERVRQSASGESYFAPEEVQHDSARYHRIMTSLGDCWGAGVASLFEQAWHSETEGDCPTFGEWLVTLPQSVMMSVRAGTTAESAPKTIVAYEPMPETIEMSESSIQIVMLSAQRKAQANDLAGALEDYQQAYTLADTDYGIAAELALMIRDLETRLHAPQPQPEPQPPSLPQPRRVMSPAWFLTGLVIMLLLGGLWWRQTLSDRAQAIAKTGTAVAVHQTAMRATEQAQQTATALSLMSTARVVATGTAIAQGTELARIQSTETARVNAEATQQIRDSIATVVARVDRTRTAQAPATQTAQAILAKATLADSTTYVNAAVIWMMTNVRVSQGDDVYIEYISGNWTADKTRWPAVDAGGYATSSYRTPIVWCPSSGAPLLNSGVGVLVARIEGNASVVEVGQQRLFTAHSSGNIQLMMNDSYDCVGDNDGAITVSIRIYRP